MIQDYVITARLSLLKDQQGKLEVENARLKAALQEIVQMVSTAPGDWQDVAWTMSERAETALNVPG